LHKIKGAIDAGVGEEYYLPGVHSDIGGSYNQANELQLERQSKAGLKEEDKEYVRSSDEGNLDINADIKTDWKGKIIDNGMIINVGGPKRIAKDRQDMIDQGWYKENEILAEEVEWDEDTFEPTESILMVSRQGISSAYSNIPLKIMARYARKPDVKLTIDDKLEDRADVILKPETELKDFAEKLDDYIDSHKNTSKPEDWVGENAFKEYPELKEIRHKHFHFSASKMSAGYKPNFEWDDAKNKFIRKRYYYNA